MADSSVASTGAAGAGGVVPDVMDILRRHPQAKRDSLIPVLQEVQERLGYLSKEAVVTISRHLNLPASKVYGVATFYNQFRFQPTGRFHIQLCRGTACHVKNSAAVLDTVQRELNIKAGETTRDGMFSLEVVACVGACGLAPVICINGEFYAGMTPKKARALLNNYQKEGARNDQSN